MCWDFATDATVAKVLVVISCSWVWWACDDDSSTKDQSQAQAQETEVAQQKDDDSAAEKPETPADEGEASSNGDANAAPGVEATVEEVFFEVAQNIDFEPYRGILRGPENVQHAGSANAADQAMLLGHRLASKNHDIRYVRGELDDDELDALLKSMYLEEVRTAEFDAGDHEAFEPLSDDELRETVRDHMWVEVAVGDEQWLPLDPAFPDAEVGEAYTDAEEYFDSPPQEWFQSVEFTVYAETKDGDVHKVGTKESTVPELAEEPPLLVVRPIPVVEELEDEGAAGAVGEAAGALGSLGDDSSSDDDDDDPDVMGHNFHRYFSVGGETRELDSTPSLAPKPA